MRTEARRATVGGSGTTVRSVRPTDPVLGPVMGPSGSWPARHRYALLAAAVVLLTTVQTLNGQWSTDMWEHVAVVRELIAHPFDPSHPLILSDATHPGYSPYTVLLGILGHLSGTGAIAILSVAAVVNVGVLLVAFRLFVLEVTENERAPFWALLFVLALWGFSLYRYSGFYGLNSIGFVAPYPSTIATAVALGTLVAAIRFARSRRTWLLVPVALGTALVLLVHPLSGPWLLLALAAVAISRVRGGRSWAWAAAALAGAVGLCLLWPYYSVVDLVRDTTELDALNESMYTNVLLRLFPALLGVIVIVRRSRADRGDLLGLFLAGAGGLWVVGAIIDDTSYGRALAFVVIVLDIALADGVARIEADTGWRAAPRPVRLGAGLVGALLLLGVVTTRTGWVRMVPGPLLPASVRSSEELARPDEELSFLVETVGPTEVVIGSRPSDNRVVPALAGRSLALVVPRPFVEDADTRRRAQREYLDPSTDPARRRAIEEQFDIRFVLLHANDPEDRALLALLRDEGASVVNEENGFTLVALEQPIPQRVTPRSRAAASSGTTGFR